MKILTALFSLIIPPHFKHSMEDVDDFEIIYGITYGDLKEAERFNK